MSDHFDTADAQDDLTDLYVFAKPGDPSKTIFLLDLNPDAPKHAAAFDPRASYEWKIDADGDLFADLAYHVLFTEMDNGRQSATLYRAVGPQAEGAGALGEVLIAGAPACFDGQVRVSQAGGLRLYVGLRSDPFFFDMDGYLNNFRWTGQNVNAAANVFTLALELPNREFGGSQSIGVWARTMAPVHGELHQVDQIGRPGTSPLFFNGTGDEQALFNGSHPSRQVERFLPQVVTVFQERYGLSPAEARAEALQWLPDLLPFEPGRADTYPNGRWPNDDTLEVAGLIWTHGACGPSLSNGNENLLAEFPYLGDPHGEKS